MNAPSKLSVSPVANPLYRQIKALILQSLHQAEWKPGEAIPSEMDLAERYQVSQGTVRKAIDELAAENLLQRRQGKGTFVATHAEQHVQYRFLRLHADALPDDVQQEATRRILDCKRLKAPADIAKLLGLRTGDSVVFVERTLHFSEKPTILEQIWLPGVVFKGLSLDLLREHEGSMYAMFEAEFGVSMLRADEKLKAVAATEAQAAAMQLPLAEPLLFVERVSYTYQDLPMELRRAWYYTLEHHYRNLLQ